MTTAAAIDSIYVVKAGDTLAKIAQTFYGNPNAYEVIARQNNIGNASAITVGQKLVIPGTVQTVQTMAPAAPAGSPVTVQQGVETVTVTGKRPWYTDWRLWAGASAVLGLYIAFRRR